MADDDAGPDRTVSWHERETAAALARLAGARAQLALLEEQAAAERTEPDPADVALVEELEAQIAKLRVNAGGRFGGGAARAKLDECEQRQRAVLARLGFDDVAALRDRGTVAVPAVDPDVLAFARRECADAEQAFLEVAALEMPAAEPDADADAPDADVIAAPGSFGDPEGLDLRVEPSAS